MLTRKDQQRTMNYQAPLKKQTKVYSRNKNNIFSVGFQDFSEPVNPVQINKEYCNRNIS